MTWDGIEQDEQTAKIAAERLNRRVRLFCDTVVRRLPGESQIYLMNRKKRGWGEYAVPYRSVAEVETLYDVQVGEWQADEHGEFAPVSTAQVQESRS